MAFYPCNMGGGETLQETVLWTNDSPTSNFSEQTVTLSESLENFEYLKFVLRARTDDALQTYFIVPMDHFLTTKSGSSAESECFVAAYRRSWYLRGRNFIRVSDTSIKISGGTAVGADSGENQNCIPLYIIGLKYATPKPSGIAKGIINVTSTSTEYKVTIGFKPKQLCVQKNDASSVQYLAYDEDISPYIFRTTATSSAAAVATIGTGNPTIKLVSVDDDGFTFRGGYDTGVFRYFAIG